MLKHRRTARRNPIQWLNNTKVNSAFHPSGVG